MNASSKSLQELRQMYSRYFLYVTVMLFFLIAALVMAFVRRALVFPILAAAVLFHLALLRPLQKNYVSCVNQANLTRTLCRLLGAEKVLERAPGHIASGTILRSELMPCEVSKGSPLLCWQISGQRKELTVSVCDATIAQRFRLTGKGKLRMHFNSGVWAHMELTKDSEKRFLLLNENSVPTPIRLEHFESLGTYETAALADEELARSTACYLPKGEPSQMPSAAFLQEFRRLANYTPGYAAVSVNGRQMDVFIRGRFLARPVSMSKKPSDELLDFDPFPELSYLIRLALTL